AVTGLGAATDAASLRSALLDAVALGAMGSVPGSRFGTDADTTAALRSQADSVQAELAERKTSADAATAPIDQIEAALGESFVVLPRFRLGAASAYAAALDTA